MRVIQLVIEEGKDAGGNFAMAWAVKHGELGGGATQRETHVATILHATLAKVMSETNFFPSNVLNSIPPTDITSN